MIFRDRNIYKLQMMCLYIKKGEYMARFSITLPDSVLKWIDKISNEFDMTRSEVIYGFIVYGAQRYENVFGWLLEEEEEEEGEEEEEEEEEE